MVKQGENCAVLLSSSTLMDGEQDQFQALPSPKLHSRYSSLCFSAAMLWNRSAYPCVGLFPDSTNQTFWLLYVVMMPRVPAQSTIRQLMTYVFMNASRTIRRQGTPRLKTPYAVHTIRSETHQLKPRHLYCKDRLFWALVMQFTQQAEAYGRLISLVTNTITSPLDS
ncbi:hypothetical protein EJB05_32220, partial [Eragrostis curvula]